MAQYRIICTIQEPFYQPHNHAHIVKVGTGDDTGYSKLWTVSEVRYAIDKGDVFYTVSPSTGKRASVTKYDCANCGYKTIRSGPDAVKDNNLDSLPTCRT